MVLVMTMSLIPVRFLYEAHRNDKLPKRVPLKRGAPSGAAADFSILDGDTIEVLHNNHPERIRLSGIDCPEKGQPYGQKAKHAASAMVFGKEVTLQTHGKDKYRRTLADVLLSDGTNVNTVLVVSEVCAR